MTVISAAEWIAERLPIRFKTWCYQKKSRWASNLSVEGGMIQRKRYVSRKELDRFKAQIGKRQGSEGLVVLLSARCDHSSGTLECLNELGTNLSATGIPMLWGRSLRDVSSPDTDLNASAGIEMPIDQAISILRELCRLNIASGECGHLILANPLIPLCKYVGRFNAAGWITTYLCLQDWSHRPVAGWKYSAAAEEFLARSCDFCIAGAPAILARAEDIRAGQASGILRVGKDQYPSSGAAAGGPAPEDTPLECAPMLMPELLGVSPENWNSCLSSKAIYRLGVGE